MLDLETKLRTLAANGELTSLSVIPVAGKGADGVVFAAQVSPASRFGHVEGRDPDIATAIHKALDALPKAMLKSGRTKLRPGEIVDADAVLAKAPTPSEAEPWDTP